MESKQRRNLKLQNPANKEQPRDISRDTERLLRKMTTKKSVSSVVMRIKKTIRLKINSRSKRFKRSQREEDHPRSLIAMSDLPPDPNAELTLVLPPQKALAPKTTTSF